MWDIIDKADFWENNLVQAIGIGLALLIFILERWLNYRRERKSSKYQWFLDVIVKPHLDEIKIFYTETDKELREACRDLQAKSETLEELQYKILARKYCDSFKERRKNFFNNFVSMIGSFDKNMASKVETIINKLDDDFVTAIDFTNEDADPDGLMSEIFKNKANLYQTLFKNIS